MNPRETLPIEQNPSNENNLLIKEAFLRAKENEAERRGQKHKGKPNKEQRVYLGNAIADARAVRVAPGVFGQRTANIEMQRDMDALVTKDVPHIVQTKTEPATITETNQEQKIMEPKFDMKTNPVEKPKTPLQNYSEGYDRWVEAKRKAAADAKNDPTIKNWQDEAIETYEKSGKKVLDAELALPSGSINTVVTPSPALKTEGFHTLDIEQAEIMLKAQEGLKVADGAVESRAENAKVPIGFLGKIAESYNKMGDGLRWLTVGALVYSNKFAPSFRWLMVGGLLSAAVATLYMSASSLLEHASVIDTSAALATIREGEGVTHVLSRQLAENPVDFGFTGNLNDANEVKEWSITKAFDIAEKTGYADTATGLETRVASDGIDNVAYVLQKGPDGTFNVVEQLKGDDGIFRIQDINNSAKNAYEYQHGTNFAPTTETEPSAEAPATEPTGFTEEELKTWKPVIPVDGSSPPTNLTTEEAPVGQEAGNPNALVEAGAMKGSFQYSPNGEVVGFITNELGASADGRDLLNEDWRSTVRNHSLNGVTDGQNISVVDGRASKIAGYEQVIAVLEQDGVNNKPKIDFLRDQIQDIITKTEAEYGNVFKDTAGTPPESSSHINLPTDPQALAQLNADAAKATDDHIKSVFGKAGWFGIGADNGQKTFEAFAEMPVSELLERESRIPSEEVEKVIKMVRDANAQTGLPLESGLNVRDYLDRAAAIDIQNYKNTK